MRSRREKVVLDTNVLISGVLFEDGTEAEILQSAANADIDVFTSPDILAEFAEVIARPKLQLNREEVSAACEFILSLTKLIMPMKPVKAQVRDPGDLKLLECGREAKADFIVTGDKDLVILGRFDKAKIVTPSKFARRLRLDRS